MKKIIVICGITLVTIILAVTFLVSPVTKYIIEKKSPEILGRQVTVNKLRINIFTGSIKAQGFAIAAQQGSDDADFVSFDTLETKMRLLPMIGSRFIINKIYLAGINIDVWQKNEQFNFDDIIAHFKTDSVASVDEQSSWAVEVYNISVRGGRIDYRDLVLGSEFDMMNLALDIPAIYFNERSTDVGLKLNFADGGELATNISYDLSSSNYNVNVKLKDFLLSGTLPYVAQYINISDVNGALSTDLNIVGDVNHIMEFTVNGKAQLNDLAMSDLAGKRIVTATSVSADIKEVSIAKDSYLLNSLVAQGAELSVIMDAAGNINLTSLMKGDAPAAVVTSDSINASASTMQVFVDELKLNGCIVDITDLSFGQPFVYKISEIDLLAKNFNPDAKNNVTATATLGGSGRAKMHWVGSMSDIRNQNLTIAVSNLNLKHFTPYLHSLMGYPITNGSLSFNSQNITRNGELNGVNSLQAYHFDVDKKDKSRKYDYNIPMKTVLYVLKDKNDKIDLSLPVKGNVGSPEFSYRKIIIKTLLNVLTKVATAPFGFLSKGEGDNLEKLPFDAAAYNFSLEQYAKLTKIADAIKSKDQLAVTFSPSVNYSTSVQSIALNELKKSYFLSRNPEKSDTTLEIIDYAAISEISPKNESLINYADSLLGNVSLNTRIGEKATALFSSKADEKLIKSLRSLNDLLKQHMVREGIDSSKIELSVPTLSAMKAYTASSTYEVGIGVQGESSGDM